ncbi:carbonic anhydrase [Janthinobacterium fluminis]|uniref:carbonic anhydrase n=1 Tax=Janthinobacterium fluminis TaxID=2987524 RepID=A0ABT5K1F3_9BURK|nr:carbonic anhydrase family protein [Janthinobacterium fluminis]MDC8758812.1 carbonic anhydrase family protein [Janthinobacterium fluminis]
MRHLIALLACSFVTTAASANDAPASEAAKAAAVKTITDSVKPKPVSSPIAGKQMLAPSAPAGAAPATRSKEEQAEVDLSAKIAARLAEMRANQAARVAAAAKARRAAAAAAAARAEAPPATFKAHGNHWSYEGETGPANWGKINADWTRCGTGSRQSPIDIRDGMKVDLEQISFDYKPSSFNVVDNGHTVQVTVSGGNYLTVQGRMYELMQFHFHRPSEERINGKGFEMVVHLVHKDAEGKLAVLAILLERGKPQNTIQTVWNNLPLEKHEVMAPSIVLDPLELLPQRRDYYTYMGSLTTPPCSEGVLWLVMKEPQQASAAQMALFSRLYPLNARPIQGSSGRMIKESN